MKEKWESFSEEELKNIILTSKTFKEVASKLGYNGCNGKTSEKIRQIAQNLNITASYLEKRRKKITDYIGERNGDLEVIKVQNGLLYCKCHLCNKDELHPVSIANFYKTKSCGCRKTLHFQEGKYEDLTNQIIGNFKALEINKDFSERFNRIYWNCLCLECNTNIIPIQAWDFKNEMKRNCGCASFKKSKGEEKITKILADLNIPFYPEYSYKNFYTTAGHPYRYDFAILDENKKVKCLIEYHGKQHYNGGFYENKDTIQQRDKIKESYCKENNIPLIIIPYTDYAKIDTQYLLNKINNLSEVKNNEST